MHAEQTTVRLLFPLMFGLAACGGSSTAVDGGPTDSSATTDSGAATDSGTSTDSGALDAAAPPRTFGGDRPARLVVPSSYDASTPMPLVMLLHGYGASALLQDSYFGMSRAARERGFLLLLPDGTLDSTGKRYWDATPGCCAFAGTPVDDVSYLRGLITDVKAAYNVDASRVYLIGHSNGGFMSFRMACDAGDQITAIISLAGGGYVDGSLCEPTNGVSVLQIQGTADATVAYGPSLIGPGAVASVERWATRDGCDATMPVSGTSFDLETVIFGAETVSTTYPAGCDAGLEATLWTINGGSHIPSLPSDVGSQLYDWLSSHAR